MTIRELSEGCSLWIFGLFPKTMVLSLGCPSELLEGTLKNPNAWALPPEILGNWSGVHPGLGGLRLLDLLQSVKDSNVRPCFETPM